MVKQSGRLSLQAEKTIETKDGERKLQYEFTMPLGAPFGASYDIAHEFLQEIVQMAKEAADRTAREEKEEITKS